MKARVASVCAVLSLALAAPAAAVVYHVNDGGDASDANPNDGVCETQVPGVCTLRAAIEQANVTGGLIQVPALAITVGGRINVAHDMTIAGAGMRQTVVSGSGLFPLLYVGNYPNSTPVVTISDLTLRDAHAPDYGGAIYVVQSQLTLERCLFTNNYAGYGGAMLSDYLADLKVRDCVFTDNHAATSTGFGGAIYVYGGAANFLNTAIHHNTAASAAGVAFSHAGGVFTNCTIGSNLAEVNAGGIGLYHNADGGAAVTLESTTVAGNRATSGVGGGVYVDDPTYSYASIHNTILASNTRIGKGQVVSNDCNTVGITSNGNSIVAGICTVTGPYSTANPLLGPLQENGGTSGPTYALTSGSPAINGGSLGGCPLYDQRGVTRQTGGPCDIGAYEHAPCGDTNGDGTLTVADVFFLVNFLFAGGPAPPGLANVNGDSVVNVSDVFALINKLFAGGSVTCPGT